MSFYPNYTRGSTFLSYESAYPRVRARRGYPTVDWVYSQNINRHSSVDRESEWWNLKDPVTATLYSTGQTLSTRTDPKINQKQNRRPRSKSTPRPSYTQIPTPTVMHSPRVRKNY